MKKAGKWGNYVILLISIFSIAVVSCSKDKINEELFIAVGSGDSAAVKELLQKGAYVEARNEDYFTPLMIAATQGNIEIAGMLTDKGADVNIGHYNGITPLILSAAGTNLSMAEFLIEKGAEVDALGDNGTTALMVAAKNGDVSIAELLLNTGADVNAKEAERAGTRRSSSIGSIMDFAWMSGMDAQETVDYAFTKTVEEALTTTEEFFVPPLWLAVRSGNPGVVELLLDRGADPAFTFETADQPFPIAPGMTPFMYAAYTGQVEVMKFLLRKGSKVNERDLWKQTALMYAAYQAQTEALAFLAGSGADMNAKSQENFFPLYYVVGASKSAFDGGAILRENANPAEAAKILIQMGADPNAGRGEGGQTALMLAAQIGNSEIVKSMIESGAAVNSKTRGGTTALMWAAFKGHLETVKLLVELGAEVNAQYEDGQTALMYAAEADKPDIVRFLAESGANINTKKKDGNSALHLAAMNNGLETVTALVELGSDINAIENEYGNTPLMIAAWSAYADIIQYLLDHGADISIKLKDGRTVLDVVGDSTEYPETIIEMLKKAAEATQ